MKIAVEGCCHGELDATYRQIAFLEKKSNYNVDLLLINGDFQAIRNHSDLVCMAVPAKYRKLGEFHKYYTGEKVAPLLTIVIGGNHEASNYLWELYHGGWLAPNIYYLGCAGAIKVNGIRFAGISGIYNYHSYKLGHFERLPYDQSSLRSIYHVREYDVFRVLQLSSPDVFLSHDWPQSIEHHGNLTSLLSRKPFFKQDIESGRLGSPPLTRILDKLRPSWWFSAHLHVKFEATYHHDIVSGSGSVSAESTLPAIDEKNPDEIVIDQDDDLDNEPSVTIPERSSHQPISGEKQSLDERIVRNKGESSHNLVALVSMGSLSEQSVAEKNQDEIVIDDEFVEGDAKDASIEVSTESPTTTSRQIHNVTRFLALDKCLPKRQYLEIIDIPSHFDDTPVPPTPAIPASTSDASISQFLLPTSFSSGRQKKSSPNPPSRSPLAFTYDAEWLAITRAFHPYLSQTRTQTPFPSLEEAQRMVQRELEWVNVNVGEDKKIEDIQKFCRTAHGPGERITGPPMWYTNPQTEAFCEMLQIENKINPVPRVEGEGGVAPGMT